MGKVLSFKAKEKVAKREGVPTETPTEKTEGKIINLQSGETITPEVARGQADQAYHNQVKGLRGVPTQEPDDNGGGPHPRTPGANRRRRARRQ